MRARMTLGLVTLSGCGRLAFDTRVVDATPDDAAASLWFDPAPAGRGTAPCRPDAVLAADDVGTGLDRSGAGAMSYFPDGAADAASCIGRELGSLSSMIVVRMRAVDDACGYQPCSTCSMPRAEVFAGPDRTSLTRIAQTTLTAQFVDFSYVSAQPVVIVCRPSTGTDQLDVEVDAIVRP